jgi:hypothetical protein
MCEPQVLPKISFLATADEPTSGAFEWEQLIIAGIVDYQHADGSSTSSPAQTGLDNTVVIPLQSRSVTLNGTLSLDPASCD